MYSMNNHIFEDTQTLQWVELDNMLMVHVLLGDGFESCL